MTSSEGTPEGGRRAGGGYDLHVHSTCSDGTCAPAAVVALAAQAGLEGLALTDHDTTEGWDEAAAACALAGLEFVPGIELSAEDCGASVHLLGYWVDRGHPGLLAECRRLRTERDRRARVILARLEALGVGVDEERVREIGGSAPLGRPHIAAAMVEAGAAADLDDAFDRFLADGAPAWEPKHALGGTEAVRLLRDAGGVAVLAHPGCTRMPDGLFDRMVAAGLAGVECGHPGHDPEIAAAWELETRRRELVPTAASDFHGTQKPVKIGARTTTAATLARLRARRQRPAACRTSNREDSSW